LFSFFIFTVLDNAQPRQRTRVQPILFNIFLRIGTPVDSKSSAKTTPLAARLPKDVACVLRLDFHRRKFEICAF
jgi:hypothetical protein